ncbi:MAG: hypothetical protein J4F30_10255, partial [Acidobacteria bacterium]|nr:hypothetical protein [Acidobacteriota bacterium]
RLRRRHGLRGRLNQELRAVPGREPQVPARHDLLDAAHAVQRRRPDRPLLLRPRPHGRRHVRRVQGRAHGAHGRPVCPQETAVRRRRQRERQRHRVRRNAAEGGRRHPGRRYRHRRPRRRAARLAGPRRLRRLLQRPADADAAGTGGRPQCR